MESKREDVFAEKILKHLRNWLLIGAASIIVLVITLLFTYYHTGSRTLMLILVLVQFVLIIIATGYYLILRRFKKHEMEKQDKQYLLIEIDETATNQSIEYLMCCIKKDFPETAKKIRLIKGIVPE